MTDEATTYWLQVHHLVPWLAATRHNKAIIEGYHRREFTPEETAQIIAQWRQDYFGSLLSVNFDVPDSVC